MKDSDFRVDPIPSTRREGLQDPITETREDDLGPGSREDADGPYTGMDNGETGEDTGYPVRGDRDLVAEGSTPAAPVIDLGVTLPPFVDQSTSVSSAGDEGGDAETPVSSRREVLEAAIGQLDGALVDEPDTSPATADDDEAESDDTDEDGEKVDTSDIGYDIPTGGKEPTA